MVEILPVVAVTVRVYVPAGVIDTTGEVEPPLPPPPPHPPTPNAIIAVPKQKMHDIKTFLRPRINQEMLMMESMLSPARAMVDFC